MLDNSLEPQVSIGWRRTWVRLQLFLIWEMWKGAELESAVHYGGGDGAAMQEAIRNEPSRPDLYIEWTERLECGCGESELRSIDLPE